MVARPDLVLEALERSSLKPAPRLSLVPKDTTCKEIEAALGCELPPSARKYAAWWKTVTPEKGESAPEQVWVLPRR
jgi:hypothetical protein